MKVAGNVTEINLMRWARPGLVIAICMLLLTGAALLTNRYRANRSLMRLTGVSVEWKGTSFNWLKSTIGAEAEQALLGSPRGVAIGRTVEEFSDQAVSDLLGRLAGLESIQIHNRDLPAGCLETIATRHRVETLAFRHPCIRQDDAKWLSRMPSLKQVHLGQFVREPRENDWSWLKRLPQLESLEVTLWGASNRDVIALAECPASKELSLEGPSLTDEAVGRLCDLPALAYLSLGGDKIRLHFPMGRKLPATLCFLFLDITAADDKSMATFAGLPKLRHISITEGSITDAGVAALAHSPALSQLWLEGLSEVSDVGLERLSSSTSLREVHVDRLGTTPRGLIHLFAIKHWNDINFDHVQFNREPGRMSATPSFDSAEEFLQRRRRIQEEFQHQAR